MIVTERIPRRDVAEMVELATLRGARIIGPNCLGIIVPDVIKMGGIGGPARNAAQAYTPGPIGVISRSGGMTTEMSSTLSAAGLGQSTAVSIGGDAIIGSSYAELMPLFEADEQTQGIVIYTEPGGRMEAELARWVTEHKSRLPIVAFMAGRFMDEMPGMSFGHAGTIVEGKEDTASEKIARLAQAGITVAERIEDIPGADPVQDLRGEPSMRADGIFIAVEVDDAGSRRCRARGQAQRRLPGRHLRQDRERRREHRRARTSTSACCAGCAWPRRQGCGNHHQALRQRGDPRKGLTPEAHPCNRSFCGEAPT